MEAALLAEIRKTCKDAQYGYTKIDGVIYFKHVSALLKELDDGVRRTTSDRNVDSADDASGTDASEGTGSGTA